jgi:hypothetical protein
VVITGRVIRVVALLVALLVVMVLAGTTLADRLHYGTVADRDTTALTVRVGDRFSLTVPDRGASVGDHWTAATDPAGVVSLAGDEQVTDNPAGRLVGPLLGGGAGTRYFLFDARRAGQTRITLSNCFQGCRYADTQAASIKVTWTVTVG